MNFEDIVLVIGGTLTGLSAGVYYTFNVRGGAQFGLLLAAAVLHIVGVNAGTMIGNIPLNKQLAQLDADQLSETEADRIRTEFQGPGTPWMRWHNFRTITAIAATVLVFIACLSKSWSR
jgi:uncharacterized membrane protein